MAFDYTTLIAAKTTLGSIKAWANHSVLDSDGILTQAQAWIYEKLRAQEMTVEDTLVILETEYQATFPSGFLDPVYLRWHGDDRDVAYVHENLLHRYIDDQGVVEEGHPDRFAIFGNKLQFNYQADEDLTAAFVYYAVPTALSLANPTNFLTIRWPTLLKTVCLAFAYDDRKRSSDAIEKFKEAMLAIDDVNGRYDKARNGSTMR